MKPVNGKKRNKVHKARRVVLGIIGGSAVGLAISYIAASAGSECLILCNQTVAVPYFAAIGILAAWR